jgi:hypothetical protein
MKNKFCPISELPIFEFNEETKLIDIIKQLKETYDPLRNKVIIQVGKKSWAELQYVK